MKLLDGSAAASFIQQRHIQQIRGMKTPPILAIVRQGSTPATDMYLRVKERYGEAIGASVQTFTEEPEQLLERIHALGKQHDITGIIVELPFADSKDAKFIDAALAAVPLAKDVDGLAPRTKFDPVTPKAIRWLLASYGVDVAGKTIAVVGQGRLVGKPLADEFESMGCRVLRADETTRDLATLTIQADIIITATGQPGLITGKMVKDDAVVVDAAAPESDLARDLFDRKDLTITPNPGGVGPMTVAALFDNLLIATQN